MLNKREDNKDNKELIKKVIEDSKRYAEKQGFKLNQDDEIVSFIAEGIAENHQKIGARFCPRRSFAGNEKED